MAAIEVTVLRFTGAEDYGRITATMMRLPSASSGDTAAVLPDKFLPATLTVTIGSDPSFLYFLWSEFVIVGHRLHPLFDVDRWSLIF
jgi:hypothetical protein